MALGDFACPGFCAKLSGPLLVNFGRLLPPLLLGKLVRAQQILVNFNQFSVNLSQFESILVSFAQVFVSFNAVMQCKNARMF